MQVISYRSQLVLTLQEAWQEAQQEANSMSVTNAITTYPFFVILKVGSQHARVARIGMTKCNLDYISGNEQIYIDINIKIYIYFMYIPELSKKSRFNFHKSRKNGKRIHA